MLVQILTHTPAWVFAVFALLAWLGAKPLSAGASHLYRVVGISVAMAGLGAYGVASAFGRSPAGLVSLAAWIATAAATGPAPARHAGGGLTRLTSL